MKPLVAILLVLVACPSVVHAAADPDPDEFTPPGYEFCGWQDFTNGGWAMEWSDDLAGAGLVAFADGISCYAARKNIRRLQSRTKARAVRAAYRCNTLEQSHEYLDVRCVKRRGTGKFRYQTGA